MAQPLPLGLQRPVQVDPEPPPALEAAEGTVRHYALKDFRGSSHQILARWLHELPPGAQVLELGPGDGQVSRLLGRSDLGWSGLDKSIHCLPVLVQRLGRGAIADIDLLERFPAGFHAVLAADCLEHLMDPWAVLRRIQQALSPEGLLFVSVPNVAHLYARLLVMLGRFPYSDRGIFDRTHRVFFTRRTLREALSAAGLEVKRETVSTVPLPLAFPGLPPALLAPCSRLLGVLTRLLPTLLGYQLLVVAQKPPATARD